MKHNETNKNLYIYRHYRRPYPNAADPSYFIDKLVCLGGTTSDVNEGGYDAHLRLDPLMTYRSDIQLAELFVARNEFDYDRGIIDTSLAQKSYHPRTIFYPSTDGDLAVATPLEPTVILQTVSQRGYTIYAMSLGMFEILCDTIWGYNWQTWFFDPVSSIIRCFLVPYPAAELQAAYQMGTVNGISIGRGELTPPGFVSYYLHLENNFSSLTSNIRTSVLPLPRQGGATWKNRSDVYEIYMPFVGRLNLSAEEVYFDATSTDKSLEIRYVLDIITGDLTAEIGFSPSHIGALHHASGNCSIPIPFSSSNNQVKMLNGITGLVSTAAATSAGGPAGYAAAAGAAASTMNNMRTSTQISGTLGGASSWGLWMGVVGWHVRAEYANDSAGYARTHGRPLYDVRTGSALQGFTICENVHIQPPNCPANVAAEIKQLLESGVYFDEGE